MKTEEVIEAFPFEFDEHDVEALMPVSRRRLDRALGRIRRPAVATGMVESPLGRLLVAASERGVAMVHYTDRDDDIAPAIMRLRAQFDPVENETAVAGIGADIRRYLEGGEEALSYRADLTLAATPFQKRALGGLLRVPRGALVSYQALGAAIGNPEGSRAIGNAMHNNPVPIYVPCHRVITSDGRLGGYGGGHARKIELLRVEGFAVDESSTRIPERAVWGHRGTKIYCHPNCRAAIRVDRTRILFFADSAQARHAGMRACKICRPV